MKRTLNDPPTEEPSIQISPEADAAMRGLKEPFFPSNAAKSGELPCSTEGPTEFDVLFESIMDEMFGDSEYKQWVRRLYELGLISGLPNEWK